MIRVTDEGLLAVRYYEMDIDELGNINKCRITILIAARGGASRGYIHSGVRLYVRQAESEQQVCLVEV
jgi:hypothetical protein